MPTTRSPRWPTDWRWRSAAWRWCWRWPGRRCCTRIAGSRATPTRCWRERCAGPACIRGWGGGGDSLLARWVGGRGGVVARAVAAGLYRYRWVARHADSLLARALRWTRMHPRLGRYAAAMIDPNRPESASLLILAVCLLAIGVAWFALLGTVLMRSEPLALDRAVYETMLPLRHPLADRLMAGLASKIGRA